MQARKHVSLFLLALALSLSSAAKAHPEYRVTVVGPANSRAADINAAGVVVGSYAVTDTTSQAFLNRGRGVVTLGRLGGASSAAVAINDKGVVLGTWITGAGASRGFLYFRGRQRDIGTVATGSSSNFTDINNAGYITATGAVPGFDGPRGFLRSPDGRYTDIGALPFENPLTIATALNNRKQITGASGPLIFPDQPIRAIIWERGVMRDLGDLGFDFNSGLDINDRGQITGYASLPLGFRARHAFLWSHGRMIDIDGRPDVDFSFSIGTGINNRGHVVGSSDHLSGFIFRGRRMQSLNALIDPRLGWDVRFPEAINDAGQIAATAIRGGVNYAVRLDLIRRSAEGAVILEPSEEGATPLSAAEAAAEAQADAQAEAQEVARPVQ